MIEQAQRILKKYYGYSEFRKGQDEIIENILKGNDTFCIMPTGGGKSICYQIPALMMDGITIVISPLISLMKDQVDALHSLGIPSTFINSSIPANQVEARINGAFNGIYKIVYIAPERLESLSFSYLLNRLPISMIAIDEAHCVSQWGHDFRPSYLSITTFINQMERRPVVTAFTATATEEVKKDVVKNLSLKAANTYVLGFDRENLHFAVERGVNKLAYVKDYLNTHKSDSGIIYAATRKEVDRLFAHLLKMGFSVGKYHAGLGDTERKSTQDDFLFDNVNVIIATNAFGMGIDKSNVRFVIHYNTPKNMESYYQEAGRAGRDGARAECILLFAAGDLHIQKFLIEQTLLDEARKANEYKKLQIMADYCHTNQCLRKFILSYFGDRDIVSQCNNCSACNDDRELVDISIDAQKIFSCIVRMGERFGINLVANVLKGSNIKKIRQFGFEALSTYGLMKDMTIVEITDLINMLIAEDYLKITEGKFPTVKLKQKAIAVLKGREKIMHKVARKPVEVKTDPGLFDILKALRKNISENSGLPPYVIFHDKTLHEMCKFFPQDKKSMLSISGVGENKFEKYGEAFIDAVKKYVLENNIKTPRQETEIINPKKDKTPTHLITYELYKQSMSIDEMCNERNLKPKTIQDHLVKCFQEGFEIDWDRFIPENTEDLILKAINETGAARLKPIKDILPEEIEYMAIKAVICKHF